MGDAGVQGSEPGQARWGTQGARERIRVRASEMGDARGKRDRGRKGCEDQRQGKRDGGRRGARIRGRASEIGDARGARQYGGTTTGITHLG